MTSPYFTRSTYEFLRDLAANNEKSWWEENKGRYVRHVRKPALDLITDFGDQLAEISPHFSADARSQGGSLMRPHRDMRFSEGPPYKTNVGIQFRHERARDVHAPGFYLHIEPGHSFAAAGVWRPDARLARVIREAIAADPEGWGRVAHNGAFSTDWDLARRDGDRLQRLPRELEGIAHPHPDDLRLRSFAVETKLSQKTIISPSLLAELGKTFKSAAGYTRFLCEAIGVPF